jgi:hypothetical protein
MVKGDTGAEKIVSKNGVIETPVLASSEIPRESRSTILKLISLSSYSYLAFKMSFETIKELCQRLSKRKNF